MNSRMFFMNLGITVAFMAVAAGIEAFLPLFSRGEWTRGRARANLSFTAVNFAFSWVLTSVTAILALSLRPAGLLAATRIPIALQVIITIVVLDFMYGYASHVLLHKIPWMWRAHQIHHSDPFVDVTTNFRTHPIETLWRFLFMTIPVWALGLPASGIVIYRLMGTLNGVLEHANVRLWQPLDKFGCLIWVTPNMHKVHHSNEHLETDSNYGNILSVYDRVFRTFTNTERAHHVVYGLKETDPADARSFVGLLSQPFAAERRDQPKPATLKASR